MDDFIHVITDNEKLLLLNWHVLNMLIEWKQFYFYKKVGYTVYFKMYTVFKFNIQNIKERRVGYEKTSFIYTGKG